MNHVETLKRAAELLHNYVNTYSQASEEESGGYCSEEDAKMDGVATALDALREELEQQEPVVWRYQDARGHYRYRKYVPGFDKHYSILRPVSLYVIPPDYKARIDALSTSVRMANEQAEKFEREWYLRGDELDAANSRLHEVATFCATVVQERDALKTERDALESMAHRLALDLECLLLSTDNPAATKWWTEANATLDAWRALQEPKP